MIYVSTTLLAINKFFLFIKNNIPFVMTNDTLQSIYKILIHLMITISDQNNFKKSTKNVK